MNQPQLPRVISRQAPKEELNESLCASTTFPNSKRRMKWLQALGGGFEPGWDVV